MLHDDDAVLNTADDRPFAEVVAARLNRRDVLSGGLAVAAAFFVGGAVFGGVAGAAPVRGPGRDRRAGLLGFTAIGLGYDDEVRVPAGYTARTFIPWGTPLLGSRPAFVPGTPPFVANGNTAAQQAEQIGAHHDGMHYFPVEDKPRGQPKGILVVNHEYVDEAYLHTGTTTLPDKAAWTLEMVRKSQNAHGVSVVQIGRNRRGEWEILRNARNRRITANSPMRFTGPAAGHRLLRTSADPSGRAPLGTFNNCAHGYTPWGTYLTCEENFNGYFRLDAGAYDAEHAALNSRYGIGGDRNNWATNDARFVVTPGEPNEPHRHGWVVEIDPFDPSTTPQKRTALGRTKHEGAWVHESKDGRAVVYMGDDQVNEYAYKFVTERSWRDLVRQGRRPLDHGTLYVARFDDDGSGTWLPLVQGRGPLKASNGFANQGDVLIKTRLAATALGATPMDRPEWVAVDPTSGLVYLTLTNNTSSAKVVSAANPRKPNPFGHIIRWEEEDGDHAATSFTWDLYVLAGAGRDSGDGSTIDAEDAFGSPDGLWADGDGRVWIQTDGNQPAGANNQMLASDPAVTDGNGVPEIRRFLTGPVECEVTGVITTPDRRTMFINIQHPGEDGGSSWPNDDGISTPRSSTVIITKNDGGVIGS